MEQTIFVALRYEPHLWPLVEALGLIQKQTATLQPGSEAMPYALVRCTEVHPGADGLIHLTLHQGERIPVLAVKAMRVPPMTVAWVLEHDLKTGVPVGFLSDWPFPHPPRQHDELPPSGESDPAA